MQSLIVDQITLCVAGKKICENFTLQMNPGECWGILGPNGSGKTSLLYALAGLRKISQGKIILNSRNLKSYTRKDLAQKIGILFQQDDLFLPITVREYCFQSRFPHRNFFSSITQNEIKLIDEVLKEFELSYLNEVPLHKLSGGEKQRVRIASLLCQTPQYYFLDEPSNHLDIKYQFKILNYLKKLSHEQQKTLVIAFHDINLAQRFCDRMVLLFREGYAVEGPVSSLLTEENLANLYGCQFLSQKTFVGDVWFSL